MSFLKQDAFSLIYVKYRTFCKHCHLKNYQGAFFGEDDSRFSFESAHEFADKNANYKKSRSSHLAPLRAWPTLGSPRAEGDELLQ